MLYASLDDAREENKAAGTGDDGKLLKRLRVVSRRIDKLLSPERPREMFAPTIETRRIPITSMVVNSHDGTLRIADPLLALTTAVLGTTTLTAVEAFPSGVVPIPYLRLTDCCGSWYSDPACARRAAPLYAVITGVWGIHRDYANAWAAVDALTAAIVTTTAATLTVADADGTDLYGLTPRFSPGNLIKIDDEFMEVLSISTNTLTVRRGVNGSTAATHLNAAPVYVWQVEEAVRDVVARQAAMKQARRGAFETVQVTPLGGEIRFAPDMLVELRAVVGEYSYGM